MAAAHRQLIQKEHAVVRPRHVARPRHLTATDQPHLRDRRVLRSAPQPLQGGEDRGATSQTELALAVVDAEGARMPFPL